MPLHLATLARERVVFFDCATGTTLQALGLAAGERPETWNIRRPDVLVGFHRQCLEAGAELLKINTFGANSPHFPPGGAFALKDLIFAAVANAKTAIRQTGREGSAWAACGLGPTGKLLAPYGDLAFEDAVAIFREAAAYGAAAGADLILVETMSDTLEAKAAVLGAKEGAPALPLAVTMSFAENGRLLTGGTPAAAVTMMEALGAQAFGVNCGAGPERALRVLPEILRLAHIPVIANPNAGLPRLEGDRSYFDMTPADFAQQCEVIFDLGAALQGGCCGTTPAHIAALTMRLRGRKPVPPQGKDEITLCSARKTLVLGSEPAKIAAFSAAAVEEALQSGIGEDICDEAMELEGDGAELLALQTPAGADPQSAAALVEQLQGASQLPLCFDFAGGGYAALEAMLRRCNGVPLVRCKSREDRQAVQTLAAQYGAVVEAAP
ncbi:MAG: homocysteine S-methyltransferase family protein [Oscillospiraceae bacterium]|jgi:5-methyltetrahydrofolate--homocysteine methyltransferase|nr:homocysteine S-methyltransferase family protein [Oscillospiraceae bacterium]